MRLLLLSDINSVHTIKWVTSLAKKNIDILLLGLGSCNVSDYNSIDNIKVISLDNTVTRKEGSLTKIKYFYALPIIRKQIAEFKPNIVHAHYATSYGILGALSGFHPFILSVWGGDVYSFPKKSYLHKYILKYNLKKADKILSTSYVMAKETKLYTDKDIEVTPFGIDMEQFKPIEVDSLFDRNDIVIGTVKTLEEKYGIEYLIKAFKILSDKYYKMPLKLLIVGGGSLEYELKKLTKDLCIDAKTIFTGAIPFSEVPRYHNMLSVSVSVSITNSESFGVAIVEASSCAKPVIVSNVGGLPEVVEDGVTGFVVPPKNVEKTAKAMERLVLNYNMRVQMGSAGRERVDKLYNWKDNVAQMIKIYQEVINK